MVLTVITTTLSFLDETTSEHRHLYGIPAVPDDNHRRPQANSRPYIVLDTKFPSSDETQAEEALSPSTKVTTLPPCCNV
jgi:hypothetical protein